MHNLKKRKKIPNTCSVLRAAFSILHGRVRKKQRNENVLSLIDYETKSEKKVKAFCVLEGIKKEQIILKNKQNKVSRNNVLDYKPFLVVS